MKIWKIEVDVAAACLLAVVAVSASASLPSDAWAKHKKTPQTSSSDPCAEPTAFVQGHVAQIRALKATLSTSSHATVTSLFGSSSARDADQDTMIKIADLRHDAEGVNELLRVGGCKTIDIDGSLKTAAATPAPSAAQAMKKKHH